MSARGRGNHCPAPEVYSSDAYLLVTPSGAVGSDFAATQLTQLLTKTYSELIETPGVADAVDQPAGTKQSGEASLGDRRAAEPAALIEAEAASPERRASSPTRTRPCSPPPPRSSRAPRGDGPGDDRRAGVHPAGATTAAAVLYLALGALLAALAGLGAALLRDRLDQRVMLDSAARRSPACRSSGASRAAPTGRSGAAALGEASRLLLANLAFANMGQRPRSVAVVSAGEGEGKSTCTLSVGHAAAELGTEVLSSRPTCAARARGQGPGRRAAPGKGSRRRSCDRRCRSPTKWSTSPARRSTSCPPGRCRRTLPRCSPGIGSRTSMRALAPSTTSSCTTRRRSAPAPTPRSSPRSPKGVVLVVDATKTHRTPMLQAIEQLRRSRANVLGVRRQPRARRRRRLLRHRATRRSSR